MAVPEDRAVNIDAEQEARAALYGDASDHEDTTICGSSRSSRIRNSSLLEASLQAAFAQVRLRSCKPSQPALSAE